MPNPLDEKTMQAAGEAANSLGNEKITDPTGCSVPPSSVGGQEEGPSLGIVRGSASGREFDPNKAGGPIQKRTSTDVKISHDGIDTVERHIARFGPDEANAGMVRRLRDIADGKMEPSQADLNFYTHELDELERYTNLGYPTGQPPDPDAARELWNNAHTAALEDYGLKEGPGVLYHPSVVPDD